MLTKPTIRTKIISIVTISSLLSIVVAMGFIGYKDYRFFKNDLIDHAKADADMLAFSVAPALFFGDKEAADKSLEVLRQRPNIISSSIYDINREELASYQNKAFNDSEEPRTYPENIGFTESSLIVVQPIIFDKEIVGNLVLRLSLNHLNDRIVQYKQNFLITFILTCILMVMLAFFLQRIITVPIRQLAAVASQITTDGDYHKRVEHSRSDEIGSLLDAFNTMMSRVQNRDKQLLRHSEELERIVKLRTQQLHERANFDALTNLPNRYLLMDKLNQAIDDCKQDDKMLSLLFLDLDRFKIINDNLGHHIGDKLLKSVAERLLFSVGPHDTVCRLAGDEFIVLSVDFDSTDALESFASNLLSVLEKPFDIMGHRLHISSSIGISVYPQDGLDADQLMRRADTSMYDAKRRGLGLYSFFNHQLESESMQRLTMETKLRHAIADNDLYLVYQSKHCADTGHLVGFEALLRWEHQTDGFIPPSVFIPIAEESGLIDEIGLYVVRELCLIIHDLQAKNYPELTISLNLSAKNLMSSEYVHQITEIVDDASIPPNLLEIEITEDTFLHSSREISLNIQKLKAKGISIAIDDFGTGYSSLSYLRSFPVDILKIDGCFIKDLDTDEASKGIVSSIIVLGHSLGLVIVAECVETESQLNFLKQHGCDVIQGFYFSEPIDKEEVPDYINSNEVIPVCHKEAG